MDVLEPAERLVDERLEVRVGERLLRADLWDGRELLNRAKMKEGGCTMAWIDPVVHSHL